MSASSKKLEQYGANYSCAVGRFSQPDVLSNSVVVVFKGDRIVLIVANSYIHTKSDTTLSQSSTVEDCDNHVLSAIVGNTKVDLR